MALSLFIIQRWSLDLFLELYLSLSMDDMARYDAPAAIDKVLSLSGASALYLVGHSQVFHSYLFCAYFVTSPLR